MSEPGTNGNGHNGNGHGKRKVQHAREQAVFLIIGFGIAVWAKVPVELFVAFVVGLTGLSGAFIYGNSKEHLAKATPPTQPA